jgi:hypothetical protein
MDCVTRQCRLSRREVVDHRGWVIHADHAVSPALDLDRHLPGLASQVLVGLGAKLRQVAADVLSAGLEALHVTRRVVDAPERRLGIDPTDAIHCQLPLLLAWSPSINRRMNQRSTHGDRAEDGRRSRTPARLGCDGPAQHAAPDGRAAAGRGEARAERSMRDPARVPAVGRRRTRAAVAPIALGALAHRCAGGGAVER